MFISLNLKAEDKLYCSLYYAFKFKEQVSKLENDKQMHCSMSCLIARRCKKGEVLAIGLIKEFVDAMGAGTPDPNDIRANVRGIQLAGRISSDRQCYSKCILIYP